jgi:hypothetical protein
LLSFSAHKITKKNSYLIMNYKTILPPSSSYVIAAALYARVYIALPVFYLTLLTLPAPDVFKMSHSAMRHKEKSWGGKGQKGNVFFRFGNKCVCACVGGPRRMARELRLAATICACRYAMASGVNSASGLLSKISQ